MKLTPDQKKRVDETIDRFDDEFDRLYSKHDAALPDEVITVEDVVKVRTAISDLSKFLASAVNDLTRVLEVAS